MPFLTEDGKYNYDAVFRQVDTALDNGIAGIFALTTSGQSELFDIRENKTLTELVSGFVDGRVPLYVGIGDGTDESYSREMLRHSQTIQADAAVVKCAGMTPDEQVDYFRQLNEEGAPLIAYTLGNGEKRLQRIEDIMVLPRVIAAKATIDLRTEGNDDYFKRVVATGKPVYAGDDVSLLAGLQLGAIGGINAMANFAPDRLVAIPHELRIGHFDHAKELQQDMNSLLNTLYYGKDTNGQPIDGASALQCAMAQRFHFGNPTMKEPHPTYTDETAELIHRAALWYLAR